MTNAKILCLLAVAIGVAPSLPTRAADPVAMVEETSATGGPIAPFDYLSRGQTIVLGTHDHIIIDYFASCVRETIVGGTLTIGTKESRIEHGKVRRERVSCDGGHLVQDKGRADDSAVVVFRKLAKPGNSSANIRVERRIYAVCPLVNVSGIDSLTVERVDQPEAPIEVALTPDRLVRGVFYDFAAGPCPFVAGGIYRLTSGSRSIVFAIDATARQGKTPLVGRLLSF